MGHNYPRLDASLSRAHRFKEELNNCDSTARFHLLAAWKELIMDNLVELLRATSDVDSLAHLDRAIALSHELADLERLSA